MDKSSNTIDVDFKALNALIERVQHAIDNNLGLSTADMQLLLHAIMTLSTLQAKMEQDDVTLAKLRKLLGIVKQSESRSPGKSDKKKSAAAKKQKKRSNKKHKPKRPAPTVVHHAMTEYARGELCPECSMGKLYKFEPAKLLRVTGHARFEAEQHIIEQLRCNACQKVFTAVLPDAVLEDGDANQMYGHSARALMVIDKFFSGLPYYHQGTLADIFGFPMSASTIFDQCELVANALTPIFYELIRQAANANQFLIDDTHNRILEQKPEERDKKNGKGKTLRTGVYSSGLIAELANGYDIVLYDTSLGHAGEHLDKVLQHREQSLPPPLVMSDALSSNLVTQIPVRVSYCNAHARRQFYDLESLYPDDIGWVLDTYARIWQAENDTVDQNLSLEERLAYHQEHSVPAMQEIKAWAEAKAAAEDFEEHSVLGKAIKYFLNHYPKLSLFCVEVGALIDNNRMEEKLKLIIRIRKTAHFYRTVNGAGISNILSSIIATAYGAGKNVFEYLLALQKRAEQIKASPSAYLPWNYEETIEAEQPKQKESQSENSQS